MPRIEALTRKEVDKANQTIFDELIEKRGRVANLYATYANSPVALKANLSFGSILKEGSLGDKEIETIALTVSEENQCTYCLAAHTLLGKKAGLTDKQVRAIRDGTIEDPRLRALSVLSREVVISRGKVSDDTVERFFQAGYDRAALVETIAIISLTISNNYLSIIAQAEIDFPAAPSLAA